MKAEVGAALVRTVILQVHIKIRKFGRQLFLEIKKVWRGGTSHLRNLKKVWRASKSLFS
jgi:hypothetical protein